MQTSAVYACVRVISESVARLPLHLYRYNKDGGKEKAIDHPLYHLLHDEPNPEMTVDRDEKGHLYYEYMVSSQPRALKMERRIPMRDKKKFWNWKNRKVLNQETNEEKEP